MDKRKTIFTAVVIGAGIMAIIDRIKLHKIGRKNRGHWSLP